MCFVSSGCNCSLVPPLSNPCKLWKLILNKTTPKINGRRSDTHAILHADDHVNLPEITILSVEPRKKPGQILSIESWMVNDGILISWFMK